jgi:hypothetical protein
MLGRGHMQVADFRSMVRGKGTVGSGNLGAEEVNEYAIPPHWQR